MPKANLSWDLDKAKLVVTILATSKKLTFDLTKIYPNFAQLKNVPQMLIAYGAKQKLADKCAKEKDMKLTPAEMEAEMKALWERLVGGIWRIEGESRQTKLKRAWDTATNGDKKVLEKLGLKPV